MKRLPRLVLLTLCVISIAGLASATTWTLSNSNGGDGYVVTTPTGFQLWGATTALDRTTLSIYSPPRLRRPSRCPGFTPATTAAVRTGILPATP